MGEWSLKSCNAKKGDLSCVNSVSNCQLTADCIAAIIRRLTSYRRSFNCNPSPFEKNIELQSGTVFVLKSFKLVPSGHDFVCR